MLHHKNPESNDSGFFAWTVQDENSSGADRRLRRKQGGEAGAALRFFKAPPRGCGKGGKRNSQAAQQGKQSAQWDF